jgi:ring-1,2-phenylacetyl-CoA epoxidase subunit PaaC
MFMADDVDRHIAAQGIGPDPSTLYEAWKNNVVSVLAEATLTVPADGWMQRGGKQGIHTEHMGFILAEMQHIPRTYPNATW